MSNGEIPGVPPEAIEEKEKEVGYEEQIITNAMRLPGEPGDKDRTEALEKAYAKLTEEERSGESLLDWLGRIENEVSDRKAALSEENTE